MKGDRHGKIRKWIKRGNLAVEVEVEAVYFAEEPSEACLEPQTVKWLNEVARRVEKGDLKYLQKVGKVYQLVES